MARKAKKHHEEGEMGEAWLLPYSDLMTLLLAVFIVLFAVSQVDEVKSSAMSSAFQSLFGVTGGTGIINNSGDGILDGGSNINDLATPPPPTSGKNNSSDDVDPSLFSGGDLYNLRELQGQLQTYFAQEDLGDEVYAHIDERGLVVTLTNSLLFDSGKADIKSENVEILLNIAETINNLDNYIRIEGHTDNVPMSGTYPSNWELSSARAARVVRLFIDRAGIPQDKLVVVAYADTRPVADNRTPEGRAENRRVDIIVLNMKYNSLESPIEDVFGLDEATTGTTDTQ